MLLAWSRRISFTPQESDVISFVRANLLSTNSRKYIHVPLCMMLPSPMAF